MADGFRGQEGEEIPVEALERALDALDDFAILSRRYGVGEILAVSTGVIRRAANRNHFLDLVKKRTGINASIVSGEEEARLTYKGISHGLKIEGGSPVIFDMGGGTTEFVFKRGRGLDVKSVPLGVVALSQRFLSSDPPADDDVGALSAHIDVTLERAFLRKTYVGAITDLIGSGGTVTTLAAMLNRINVNEIIPEKLNGLILEGNRIKDLFTQIRSLSISERMRLPGLDRDRAAVILAGAVSVIRILHFFNSTEMTVSHSDILEGILISYLQGGKND